MKMVRATKQEVKLFSSSEKTKIVDAIFSHWRNHGFPQYELTKQEQIKEWDLLQDYDRTGMIDLKGHIKQTMHGLGLAWNYFPHHWGISVGGKPTVLDIWNDDEKFKKAIARRLNRGGLAWDENGNPHMTISIIRKALMACSSAQRVSNFRPTAAASIYDKYSGNGIVWDMSCGFGGRLLGAFTSNKVKLYVGTEPSTLTFNGLEKLAENFHHIAKTQYELHKIGSEDFVPSQEVDLCFTSPPYFDTEKYSDEPTQSAIKFPTPVEWNNKFLRQTIKNSFVCLNKNGYLILNVASVKSHPFLVPDTIRIAQKEGFKLVDTLKLTLSAITKGAFKYEPVFVFQK